MHQFTTGTPLKTAIAQLVSFHLNPSRPTVARFNGLDLTIPPEAVTKDPAEVVAEIEAQYWQASAARAAQSQEKCRQTYTELAAEVASGLVISHSDDRMWVKQVEAILGIAPEDSLLRK